MRRSPPHFCAEVHPTSSTANRIELSGLVIDGQMRPDGEYWNAETFFVYEHAGVRIEHYVSFHE